MYSLANGSIWLFTKYIFHAPEKDSYVCFAPFRGVMPRATLGLCRPLSVTGDRLTLSTPESRGVQSPPSPAPSNQLLCLRCPISSFVCGVQSAPARGRRTSPSAQRHEQSPRTMPPARSPAKSVIGVWSVCCQTKPRDYY